MKREYREILEKLKSYKDTIEMYESMSYTSTNERILYKYELRFVALAWVLGYETEKELSNFYNSL